MKTNTPSYLKTSSQGAKEFARAKSLHRKYEKRFPGAIDARLKMYEDEESNISGKYFSKFNALINFLQYVEFSIERKTLVTDDGYCMWRWDAEDKTWKDGWDD